MDILQFFKTLDLRINSWPLQKIIVGPCKKRIEQLIVGFKIIVVNKDNYPPCSKKNY